MEIVKIPLIGWCAGIKHIFNEINQIISSNPNVQFYCLKELVHNNASNKILSDLNVKIIKNLDEIKNKKNSILILQAHGTTVNLLKELDQKNIKYVEMTCRFVKLNQLKIIEHLNQGHQVYFIGSKNHQETMAVLSISKDIKLIDFNSYKNIKIPEKNQVFITNQTTLNARKVQEIFNHFKAKNVVTENGCCKEILLRQNNLWQHIKSIDLLIVVGDKNSNNALELINIAKQNKVKSYLIQDQSQIENLVLSNFKKIGVCTSASTPKSLYEKVLKELVSHSN